MNEKRSITILQLYPRDMNIYGDWGNTLVLKRRLEWHGYLVKLREHNPGDTFPIDVDIVVGGGGQDSGQNKISDDLMKIREQLISLAEDYVPMLLVCGLYQQFGHFFKTRDGVTIPGLGLFDIETHGGNERMIGNVVAHSQQFGEIVGYENHSGITTLGPNATPLAQVTRGAGNNNRDRTEGARYRNVIGTYLHGSILPKNPAIADWLIEQAAIRKYDEFRSGVIDDRFAERARDIAIKRPR